MKTLDEVIAELEDEGLFTDALHYLKEYQAEKANLEIIKGNYQDAIANCDKAENKFKTALKKLDIGTLNDPLDWETLKTMEGKPVWVEADDGRYKGWVVVGKFYSFFENEDLDAHVNLYYFGRSMEYSKEMYGYYWQAYRKEREWKHSMK